MDSTNLANSLFLNSSFKLGTVSMDTISIVGATRCPTKPDDAKEMYFCGKEVGYLSEDGKIIFRYVKTRNFLSALLLGEKYDCEVITGDFPLFKKYKQMINDASRKQALQRRSFLFAS